MRKQIGIVAVLLTFVVLALPAVGGDGELLYCGPDNGPLGGGLTGAAYGFTNEITIVGTGLFLAESDPYDPDLDLKSVSIGGAPATILWCSGDIDAIQQIRVVPPAGSRVGATNVVVFSTWGECGATTGAQLYTYNAAGSIGAVTLDSGPGTGGSTVYIGGANLYQSTIDSDIQMVTVSGIAPTTTNGLSNTNIAIVTGDGTSEMGTTGDVVVVSRGFGVIIASNAYAYNFPGAITNVTPNFSYWYGGTSVEVTGSNLCSDVDDIEMASMGGISCSATSASPDKVYLVANNGSSVAGTTNSVRLFSKRYGNHILANSFSYRPIPSITSISTNVGPSEGGNTVVITGQNLATNTTEVSVSFVGVTGTTVYADSTVITVSVAAATASTPRDTAGDVVINSSYFGLTTNANAYTYHYPGGITIIDPGQGPGYGGNKVWLYGSNLCNGLVADVTSVTLNGVAATNISVINSEWIDVWAGDASGAEGTGNVVIVSTEYGTTTLTNGYIYNELGGITNVTPAAGLGVGGYPVIITGSNLCLGGSTSVVSVTLNGITASVQAATSSGIFVTAGDGSSVAGQTGDVVVTSTEFGVVTNAGAFSYRYNPVITNVTPNSSPAAGSTAVSITGSNLCLNAGDVSAVIFNDSTQTVITAGSATEVQAAPPAGTPGTGDIKVISDYYGTSVLQNAFTYQHPGAITNVSPAQGPAVGGNTVVITGSNLCDGTTADINWIRLNGVAAAVTQSVSETSITITAGDGSAVAIGTGQVQINSTKYGTTTRSSAYTYNYPGAVTNASMSQGPATGGNTVVLTGSNLCDGTVADITSITLNGIAVAATGAVSATSITVTAGDGSSVGGQTGDIQVVSTDFGTSVLSGGYSYNYPGGITNVSPNECPYSGGYFVDITGTNLCSSAADITSITFNGREVTATNSATATAIRVTVASSGSNDGSTGDVKVVSSLFGTTTLTDGFIYNPRGQIVSLSISNGPYAGGQSVRIYGTNMCEVDGSDLRNVTFCTVVATITNVTATYIDAITTANNTGMSTTGNVQVVSTNFGVYTLTNAYIYNGPPGITNVTPTNMPYCGGRLITIQGTNLCNGQQSDLSHIIIGNAQATGITVNSTGEITCYAPAQNAGLTNVTTYSTSHGADRIYDVIYYNYAPAITNIIPVEGPAAGGTTVTITGSNLAESASTLQSITLNGETVASTTSVSHTEIVVVTKAGNAGTGDLLIDDSTYGTSMLANAWTYNPPPAITNVTPAVGPYVGGNFVTVQGVNLCETDGSDLSYVNFNGRTATNISYKSSTVITAQLETATSMTAGLGDVVVVSTNFGTVTATNAYTYNWPGGVTSIVPNNGPYTGVNQVVISGSNLCNGTVGDVTSVTLNGAAATVTNVMPSGSQITVVAGDGTAHIGTGDVVIVSTEFGTTTEAGGYSYNGIPAVTNINPSSGPQWGGNQITVSGANLCGNVGDIVSITIAGQAAAQTNVGSADSIVVTLPNPGQSVTGPVVVTSARYGTYSSSPLTYTFNPAGGISSVAPASGPYYGGNTITIQGTDLGNGSDITNVTIGTVTVTNFTSQNATQVVFAAAAGGGQSGLLDVTVYSATFGDTIATNSYTYNGTPSITGVEPANGPIAGGSKITISGANLGNGSDVSAVMLAGVAASIDSQDATQLVVTAGSAGGAVTGDVVVTSTSYGLSTNVNGFTYVEPAITGVNPNNGPRAGTNVVTISGAWMSRTNDISSVTLAGVSAVVRSQNASEVSVYAGESAGSVTGQVVISSAYYGTITSAVSYTYNPAGSITNITPNPWGPAAGGNDVVIQGVGLGSGGNDITQVLFGTQSAYISSQAVDWVGITNVPAALMTGSVDVVVDSITRGRTTASDYYGYNFPPAVTNVSPDNGALAGGYTVVITGSNLCENLADLTSVTLAGVAATEVSATPERIEVTAGAAGSSVTGNVVITSTRHGTLTEVGAFTYHPAGAVTSVSTNNGPLAGGTEITVYGSNLGNGVDITNVTVKGVIATLKNQLSSMVTFETGDGTGAGAGLGDIVIQSISRGDTTTNNAFTYNPAGAISSVNPGYSRMSGGVSDILISGSNLGNSDITSVTLNGVAATITGQNDSQVRVSSGVASTPGTGNVVVVSTSYGTTVKTNGFIYYDQRITGLSRTSGPSTGSNLVEITGVNIGMTGDIYRVTFNGFDAALATNVQSSTNVWVWTGAATNAGTGDVKVYSTYFLETVQSNGWTYNAAGVITNITPDNGKVNGITQITIQGSNLAATNQFDITNLTVAGQTYSILSSVTPTQIVASGLGASSNVTGRVVIQSKTYGETISPMDFSFYTNRIGSIVPTNGPLAGGNEVAIYAAPHSRISSGSGTDITNVYFGTNAASIVSQDATSVVVQVSANTTAGAVDVEICSEVYGGNTVMSGYTFNPAGSIVGVSPKYVPQNTAGVQVTITGSNLGDGDITNVTLAGQSVSLIGAQSATQVVVTAASAASVTGDVVVMSTSYGTSTKTDSFAYVVPQITGVNPSSGPLVGGNTVRITGDFLSQTNDVSDVTLNGVSAQIQSQSATQIVVTAGDGSAAQGTGHVVVNSLFYGMTTRMNGYTYNPQGAITNVAPHYGSFTGGTDVAILGTQLGNGTDVTGVYFGAESASMVSQAVDAVWVRSPAMGSAMTNDITVYSVSRGVAVTQAVFAYNYPSAITNVTPGGAPVSGGNQVLITGSNLCESISDITAVTLAGVTATVDSAVSGQIQVTAGASVGAVTGDVVVLSARYGMTALTNSFSYNESGTITAVTPDNGPSIGMSTVTVSGYGLCQDKNDITQLIAGGVTQIWASILSAGPTQVVFQTATSWFSAVSNGPVVINSTLYGATTSGVDYTYYNYGVDACSPTSGAYAGGYTVTVFAAEGERISSGQAGDITNVLFDSTPVQQIISQDATSVVVVVAPATNSGLVMVDVQSKVYGSMGSTVFTFNPQGTIDGVDPAVMPLVGGRTVTITGANLCDGSDVTSVTLNGVTVDSIDSTSSSQIVVTAASTGTPGTGDVVIVSTSYGQTTKANAIAYVQPQISGASPNNGPLVGGNSVTISGTYLSRTNDVTSVTLNGVSAAIQSQNANQVVVTAGNGSAAQGTGNVVIESTFFGTISRANGYTYNPAGALTNVTPVYGSVTGGTPVVLMGTQLGNGSDVTGVYFGAESAAMVSQEVNTVWVRSPAMGAAMTNDITLYSISRGVTVTQAAFAYNYPSAITNVAPDGAPLSGGGQILITGSNLCDALYDLRGVTLAGVTASIDSATSGEILVTAGASVGAVTGDVVIVSDRYGMTALTNSFAYNEPGTITSVTPNNGPEIGGSTVTVEGSNLCSDKSDITGLVAGGVTQIWATITSASDTQVVFRTANSWFSTVSNGPVVITSSRFGVTTSSVDYTYYDYGVGSCVPSNGPYAGGYTVAVYAVEGGRISSGDANDITNVLFDGVAVQRIVSQDATSVVVVVNAATNSGLIMVDVQSKVYGGMGSTVFTFNPQGVITLVSPAQSTLAGDISIDIRGENLCNGSDVTSVTLNDIPVTSIDSVSATQVVVTAAASATSGTGDVVIVSSSYGTTRDVDGFVYYEPYGSVKVTIEPAGAITDGAQWRLTTGSDTSWHDSGVIVTGLLPGSYSANFKSGLTGWTAPLDKNLLVGAAQMTSVTGTYVTVYSVTPTNFVFTPRVGTGTVVVTTGTGAGWTIDKPADWVVVKSATNRTGSGQVVIELGANTTHLYRTTGMTIAGTAVAVSQRGYPVRNDFDKDFVSDIGCYFPPDGYWYIQKSSSELWVKRFGFANTEPVTGDFDGDGVWDYGIYYGTEGTWSIMCSTEGLKEYQWGYSETVPVTGDFDGDGRCDIAVYHDVNGDWAFLYNNGDVFTTKFGYAGTVPVTGDFDGDGIDDYGCYYAPSGAWNLNCSTDGLKTESFGYAGTVPITGDFDGDGITDFGCYYAPNGNWFIYCSTEGLRTETFGYAGTTPITGDYDGDGKCDFGCYYAPDGYWYVYGSSSGLYLKTFGYEGTIPIGSK